MVFNIKNQLTPFCFAAFRRMVWLYVEREDIKYLYIGDLTYFKLFYYGCQIIDKQYLPIRDKANMKKLALICCSKLSRDTAYKPIIEEMLNIIKSGCI